jgi:hypothetical protein
MTPAEIARGEAEAARLRACREAFELAILRNIPLGQARYEIAKRRWQEAEARLALKRCGTRAPAVPVAPEIADAGDGRELAWWQR